MQVTYDQNPMDIVQSLFARLVTALVTVLGAAIITAGLLSYGDPTVARVIPEPTPSDMPQHSEPPSTGAPSSSPSFGPSASAGPTTPPGNGVATRVVIPALQIDLPVVAAPAGYPYCNVAMYFVHQGLGQPGQGKATYLFAHARTGMFGPIYDVVMNRHASKSLIGMIVQVYTSDNKLYLYEITKALLHQMGSTAMNAPLSATTEQLWLQTSESSGALGVGKSPETQLVAMPLSPATSADPADAHPTGKPLVCG
jgi:hypothetical protein